VENNEGYPNPRREEKQRENLQSLIFHSPLTRESDIELQSCSLLRSSATLPSVTGYDGPGVGPKLQLAGFSDCHTFHNGAQERLTSVRVSQLAVSLDVRAKEGKGGSLGACSAVVRHSKVDH
jgi:hypothetical protein